MARIHARELRNIFVREYGDLPLPCAECGELVLEWGQGGLKGNVHHVNSDETNQDPANLVVTHARCHVRHHLRGTTMSDSQRAKLSATMLKKSPCPRCGGLFNVSWMTGHRNMGLCATGTDEQDEARRERYSAMGKHGKGEKVKCEVCGRLICVSHMARHRAGARCREPFYS